MTRIGINPARGKQSTYHPTQVTVALLTYIPHLEGYFAHRMDVLRLVLASLRAHTARPYDLLVFDNGSCPQVREHLIQLRDQGGIDFLILSQVNIGKIGALKVIFNAAPGEIIAYSDDDIFFYPHWLEAHLEIMSCFPKAGLVSGVPVRNAATYACQSLTALINHGAPGLMVKHERRIPDEWEKDWAASTGRDVEKHMHAMETRSDVVLRIREVEAIGSANHFQFVTPKQVILQALPAGWSGNLMGSMVELDHAVDALGFLRLSTVARYTRHLGNVLSPEIISETRALGLPWEHEVVLPPMPNRKPWILRIPGSRQALLSVYQRLFDLLYRFT